MSLMKSFIWAAMKMKHENKTLMTRQGDGEMNGESSRNIIGK